MQNAAHNALNNNSKWLDNKFDFSNELNSILISHRFDSYHQTH